MTGKKKKSGFRASVDVKGRNEEERQPSGSPLVPFSLYFKILLYYISRKFGNLGVATTI